MLLSDYENEWDAEIDDWHRCISQDSIHNWFQTCQYEHVPLDMVYINDTPPLRAAPL